MRFPASATSTRELTGASARPSWRSARAAPLLAFVMSGLLAALGDGAQYGIPPACKSTAACIGRCGEPPMFTTEKRNEELRSKIWARCVIAGVAPPYLLSVQPKHRRDSILYRDRIYVGISPDAIQKSAALTTQPNVAFFSCNHVRFAAPPHIRRRRLPGYGVFRTAHHLLGIRRGRSSQKRGEASDAEGQDVRPMGDPPHTAPERHRGS